MSTNVRTAILAIRMAENELSAVLPRDYPIGAPIAWTLGAHCVGEVVMHGYGDRIKVLNSITGRERWINAHHIRTIQVLA